MRESFSVKAWRNGKCLDLWSVNHTLAGCLLGSATYFIGMSLAVGFLISIFLMIAWELFEIKKDIRERWMNRFFDVVVGVAGFLFLYYFNQSVRLVFAIQYSAIILVVWLTLEIWGYISYKNRID